MLVQDWAKINECVKYTFPEDEVGETYRMNVRDQKC
jgi:hypothetical protein